MPSLYSSFLRHMQQPNLRNAWLIHWPWQVFAPKYLQHNTRLMYINGVTNQVPHTNIITDVFTAHTPVITVTHCMPAHIVMINSENAPVVNIWTWNKLDLEFIHACLFVTSFHRARNKLGINHSFCLGALCHRVMHKVLAWFIYVYYIYKHTGMLLVGGHSF